MEAKKLAMAYRTQQAAMRLAGAVGVLVFALLLASVLAPAQGFAQTTSSNRDLSMSAAPANGALNVQAKANKKLPSYTVTPKTKPLNTGILKSDTYTAQTKHWWMLTSFMKKFEKKGGGVITLKKGTYKLPMSISVPSNVTIVLEKGVTLKKLGKTGTSRMTASGPMFTMVPPSKRHKVGAVANYNGTHNVTLMGKGNATIDMSKLKGCPIVMAHNDTMRFEGITFKNLKSHAFELDASKNVTIDNCTFMNGAGAKTTEAINLDIPDTKTGGFNHEWAKWDKSPNHDITIQNCTFQNVMRGIGSHTYVQDDDGTNKMHTGIKILNNTFTGISGYEGCVVAYNWEDVTIEGNTFVGKGQASKTYGIVAHSVVNAWISNNTFSNYEHTILVRRGFTNKFYPAPAEMYMTEDQKQLLTTNKYVSGTVTVPDAQVTDRASYGYSGGEWFQLIETA